MPTAVDADPTGPHQAAVAAQVRPFIDGELASGIVVGLYDRGKTEIYGFGVGPGGKPPRGDTLFDLGSVTKIYTSLLLADAIQRRELSIDTPVAELLPPGVTMPTLDKQTITLRHLVLHSSGMPPMPPSLMAHPRPDDPYGGYGEDALYADLTQTQLIVPPGTKIVYSSYAAGLLGFVLGRKLEGGGGLAHAMSARVLAPLGLSSTYFAVPASAAGRRAAGSDADLVATKPWTFDALAGAGALVSTARDQLALIGAELDAAAGSKAPLRPAMHFTQEDQLEDQPNQPGNLGLGWEIDPVGRYRDSGSTAGCHAFIGFDPKTRHGVVVLSSTATLLVDRIADAAFAVLDGRSPPPLAAPSAARLAAYAGHYDFGGGVKVAVENAGKRTYLQGPAGRVRMAPISDHEFWMEALQSYVVFPPGEDKISRIMLVGMERQLAGTRVDQ